MALQPISNLGTAAPLSGTAQPNNFGAPANWVPGNGPPPGMTWSETQGQWMPSDSVVGAMPGPVASPIDNTLPIKFGMEPPNSNPYGFTAPTGPAASVMVPYYNKVTGQTWSAPSGGYTPPSADWLQGSPNPQISPGGVMPMPGFAPGMDPVKPDPGPFAPAGRAPKGYVEETPIGANNPNTGLPWGTVATPQNSTVNPMTGQPWETSPPGRAPTNGIIKETLVPDGKGGFYDTASPPPWMLQNSSTATPQQPAPNPNMSGLGALLGMFASQKLTAPPQNTGGLNSLAKPQTPINTGLLGSTQPVTRNQFAPRAGSLPSLRIRPTFKRSLPIPFAKPPFRR